MIQQAKEEDQGKYECVARNALGVTHSKAAHLYVKGLIFEFINSFNMLICLFAYLFIYLTFTLFACFIRFVKCQLIFLCFFYVYHLCIYLFINHLLFLKLKTLSAFNSSGVLNRHEFTPLLPARGEEGRGGVSSWGYLQSTLDAVKNC